MKNTFFHIAFIFIVIATIISGCNNQYLEDADPSLFTKLYRGTADITAADFILKPDNGGFLILGNTNFIENTVSNSNLILFDVGSNGYIKKMVELSTTSRDEAKKIYFDEADNSVYLLGKRIKEGNQEVTILVKTNLNADFENYTIDSTNYQDIREINYNPNDASRSFVMNDLVIIDGELVLAGYVSTGGIKSAVSRSYTVNLLFNNFDSPVSYNNQLPIEASIKPDGSQFKEIGVNDFAGYPLTLYGHKANSSGIFDIKNYLIQNVSDFSYISPSLTNGENADLKNQFFSSYHINEIDNSIIFAGENTENSTADSIFIMRAIYNPSLSGDSVGYSVVGLNYFVDEGNKVIDITQTAKGDLLIATTTNIGLDPEIVGVAGNIIEFSFLANNSPQDAITLTVAGNGFQNIKKIKYDPDKDVIYILSGVTLGTDETAIELSKFRF